MHKKHGIPYCGKMKANMSGSGEPIVVKQSMGTVRPSKKPVSDAPESLAKKHVKTKKIVNGKAVFS